MGRFFLIISGVFFLAIFLPRLLIAAEPKFRFTPEEQMVWDRYLQIEKDLEAARRANNQKTIKDLSVILEELKEGTAYKSAFNKWRGFSLEESIGINKFKKELNLLLREARQANNEPGIVYYRKQLHDIEDFLRRIRTGEIETIEGTEDLLIGDYRLEFIQKFMVSDQKKGGGMSSKIFKSYTVTIFEYPLTKFILRIHPSDYPYLPRITLGRPIVLEEISPLDLEKFKNIVYLRELEVLREQAAVREAMIREIRKAALEFERFARARFIEPGFLLEYKEYLERNPARGLSPSK